MCWRCPECGHVNCGVDECQGIRCITKRAKLTAFKNKVGEGLKRMDTHEKIEGDHV